MEFPDVDLCLRYGAKSRLQLRGKRRAPLEHGRFGIFGGQTGRHTLSRPLLGACCWRTRLFPRRLASGPARDRRARPRLRRQQNTEAVDHPGYRALPRLSVGAGAGDLRHRQRPAGPRPLLPAAQRRFRRIRGRIAAADRALPWRPDRRRLGDLELGHAILDQPRLCGARRQLRRQHRLWPRIPAAAARQLGDRRCRRLRQRRALSGAGTAGGRPRALGDQRRQRRRLHHARGADLPQRIQDRGQLLRGQRPRGAGQGHPQVRSRATSTG